MLKEFIRCASIEERLQLLNDSTAADWTDTQLNTAFEILGLPVNTNMAIDEKLSNLKGILEERAGFLADVTFSFDDTLDGFTREKMYQNETDSNSISRLASLYMINSGAIAH